MICESQISQICVNLQFPLYAVAIVGSFLMFLVNRLEEDKDEDIKCYGFLLEGTRLSSAAAVFSSIGGLSLIFILHFPIGIATFIAGISIAFITFSIFLIFSYYILSFSIKAPKILKDLKKSLFD